MDEVVVEVSKRFLDEMRRNVEDKKSVAEIVLVVPRHGNNVLLHTKAFYPKDAYRLPTGRLRDGEDPEDAFYREFREELGHDGQIARHLRSLTQKLKSGDESLDFTSYIFLTNELTDDPSPEDESEQITDFIDVPISELTSVAEQLRNLPGDWNDWGRWRAVAHDYVAKAINRQHKESHTAPTE